MTVVEGDPKAPFSIATTPRCRGGCYSFPWASSTLFKVFGMTRPGIEPRPPGPFTNTLTIMPMSGPISLIRGAFLTCSRKRQKKKKKRKEKKKKVFPQVMLCDSRVWDGIQIPLKPKKYTRSEKDKRQKWP